MRRGIAPVLGSTIRAAEFVRSARIKPLSVSPSRSSFQRRVAGRRIEGLGRAGKRVVIELAGGDRIVFEPRMTGLVLLAAPPSEEHLRLRLTLAGRAKPSELLFWDRRGLGTLSLLDPAEFARRLGPDTLGPDALELDPALLEARLGASKRPIKVALLDQRKLAGVGNIYAAECLHVARIHPIRPCASLKPAEWRRLHAALEDVLGEAIRYEGSTLNDGTYRNALNVEGGYQSCHRVYGREGGACSRCRGRGRVERIVLGQRATFFCGRCQR